MEFVRREGWQGRSVVLLFHVSEESGTERFVPLGASAPESVQPGEYSYVDDANEVICRMEVLQVEKTKVELHSTDAFYIVQGNQASSREVLLSATDELIGLTREFCDGEARMLYVPDSGAIAS